MTHADAQRLVAIKSIPLVFSSISEACLYLDRELSSVFLLIRRQQEVDLFWGINSHPQPSVFPLEETRQMHLQRLQQWSIAFQRCVLSTTDIHSTKVLPTVLLAKINHATVTLMLQTLFAATEMLYDAYTPQFAHILSLTEALVSTTSRKKLHPSAPSFEQGIIVPLSFIIMKCRQVGLRKRALQLLRQAPEREGMWNRDSVLRVAKLKVSIEERSRVGVEDKELPEAARTTRERIVELGGGRVGVYFRRSGDDSVEFMEEIDGVISDMSAIL